MEITASAAEGTSGARDLNRAITSDWPHHLFPLSRSGVAGTLVVIRQSVLNEIHRHGQSQTNVEVCGVLVGNGYQDNDGPFVYIEFSIRGEHAGNQTAQVTFTSETWCHIQEIMDREHPERRILGWYHTHPGFGIFLSPMDLFIHENFFGGHEQLALVYDPLGGDEGMFVWRDNQPVREEVLIEPDEPNDTDSTNIAVRHLPRLTAAAMSDFNLSQRMDQIERRQRGLMFGLVFVLLIAIVWPAAQRWFLPRWLLNPNEPTENSAMTPSPPETPRLLPIPDIPAERIFRHIETRPPQINQNAATSPDRTDESSRDTPAVAFPIDGDASTSSDASSKIVPDKQQ
jgi:proteasome lid subunit RPN8/RPN11